MNPLEETELVDWMALTLLPGPSPLAKAEALRRIRDPGAVAFEAPPEELEHVTAKGVERIREARPGLRARAEQELRRAEKHRVALLPWSAPGYPSLLRELPDPPVLLFVRGSLDEPDVRLALVGSRRSTTYGR